MSDAHGVGARGRRARGALVGVVVGDALGAPFEGHAGPTPDRLLARIETDARELGYTDDSAMTFALAESLLFCGGLDLDHLAGTFVATYERDPRRGYGAGTARLLRAVADGADWRQAATWQFGGQGSFGNGAAMRVAPVAVQVGGMVEEAVRLGRASATVTHTHPLAVDAAGVQAAAVALALDDPEAVAGEGFLRRLRDVAETAELQAALDAVARLAPASSRAEVAAATGTGVAAVEAVPAAIAVAVLHPDSFADAIRFAIGLGGDTDTVAAMAGAIVGASLGERAIPQPWLERAEGVARARELADRLVAMQAKRAAGGVR